MNAVELLHRAYQHREWVNRNLLEAATTLSDGQLKAEFPIGQGSVWKSLLHLYGAEYVWFEALQGSEAFAVPGDLPGKLPGNQFGEGGIADLPDLRQKCDVLKRRWSGYLAGLSPDALGENVHRYSLALQARLGLPADRGRRAGPFEPVRRGRLGGQLHPRQRGRSLAVAAGRPARMDAPGVRGGCGGSPRNMAAVRMTPVQIHLCLSHPPSEDAS